MTLLTKDIDCSLTLSHSFTKKNPAVHSSSYSVSVFSLRCFLLVQRNVIHPVLMGNAFAQTAVVVTMVTYCQTAKGELPRGQSS